MITVNIFTCNIVVTIKKEKKKKDHADREGGGHFKRAVFFLLESSRPRKDSDWETGEDIQGILALSSFLLHHSTGSLCDLCLGLQSTNEQNQNYKTGPKTALSDGLKWTWTFFQTFFFLSVMWRQWLLHSTETPWWGTAGRIGLIIGTDGFRRWCIFSMLI